MRPHDAQRLWLCCAKRPFVRPATIITAAATNAESASTIWGSRPFMPSPTLTSRGLPVATETADHPGEPSLVLVIAVVRRQESGD